MECPILFDQEKLAKQFQKIADETDNKINIELLKTLLIQMGLQQPRRTIQKLVCGIFYANKAKIQNNAVKTSQTLKKSESIVQQNEKDSQQQQQQQKQNDPQEDYRDYRLCYQQTLKCIQLVTNKIKHQIWKLTSAIYQVQHNLSTLSKRTFFPIKDQNHYAKINIVVGEVMPTYNSFLHGKLKKKGNRQIGVKKQVDPGAKLFFSKKQSDLSEDNHIKIIFQTENSQSSQIFQELWTKIFQFITAMVTGQLADGDYFLSSIKIIPQVQDKSFQLTIKSQNKDVNQFLFASCNFLNVILKTDVRFLIELGFEFSFNLKDLIENPKASLYDFLARNIRFLIKYQGSQYVTAIKQLMIAAQAFEGLQYVPDDPVTLQLISLISTNFIDLNLKFKNIEHNEAERQTLSQLMGIIQQQLIPLLQKLKQEMPDVFQLLVHAIKKTIKVEANIYDFSFQAELYLQNIDKILFERNNFFKDMSDGGESQHKSGGESSKKNEQEEQKGQNQQNQNSFQKLDEEIVAKSEQSHD